MERRMWTLLKSYPVREKILKVLVFISPNSLDRYGKTGSELSGKSMNQCHFTEAPVSARIPCFPSVLKQNWWVLPGVPHPSWHLEHKARPINFKNPTCIGFSFHFLRLHCHRSTNDSWTPLVTFPVAVAKYITKVTLGKMGS